MILMQDSTNPAAIPDSAEAVATYVDGLYGPAWTAALAAGRFRSTPKRRIACVSVATLSDTADFERYDLSPADGPVWWHLQRAAGVTNLWAYANRDNRVAVEDSMHSAGIPVDELSMWIATLDGTQYVSAYRYPVAAVQYTDTGAVDLSVVFELFGASGGVILPDMTAEQAAQLQTIYAILTGSSASGWLTALEWFNQHKAQLEALLAAGGAGLSAQQAQQLGDAAEAVARIETALKTA